MAFCQAALGGAGVAAGAGAAGAASGAAASVEVAGFVAVRALPGAAFPLVCSAGVLCAHTFSAAPVQTAIMIARLFISSPLSGFALPRQSFSRAHWPHNGD